jgi:hypothetical protein
MDCIVASAPRNDAYASAISPHDLREFCQQRRPSENQRAQGMPGAAAPAASQAKIKTSLRA